MEDSEGLSIGRVVGPISVPFVKGKTCYACGERIVSDLAYMVVDDRKFSIHDNGACEIQFIDNLQAGDIVLEIEGEPL